MTRYLLDTHVFLWWIGGSKLISAPVNRLLSEVHPNSDVYVSVASAWEITTKAFIGHLRLKVHPNSFFNSAAEKNSFQVLPVQASHATATYDLPPHHADLFDRLLIAQSITEDLVLITDDENISQYKVETFW